MLLYKAMILDEGGMHEQALAQLDKSQVHSRCFIQSICSLQWVGTRCMHAMSSRMREHARQNENKENG